MENILRDPSLASAGMDKINWVRGRMPLLNMLEERFRKEKPFAGLRVAMSIHLEAKTARLALLLQEGGAEVHVTGSNPLSTQDDVAAGLASQGPRVCAWHAATDEEYEQHILATLACKPHVVIDDGGDLVHALHETKPEYAECVIGGCEETTTGVHRLRARAAEGKLNFPMVCVNDAQMKYMFDNRYGTGQSVWDGINRTTNLIVASSTVVVAGYGWCGKGVAMRAKGLGAKVVVTEVDPVRAVEAAMDGFSVMPMAEAAKVGDFFVTVTGCRDVITWEHMLTMKHGAIMCNAGHFDVEVDVAGLRKNCVSSRTSHKNLEAFVLPNGKEICLLAEGRLVNLAAGDGHPAEIMDISFALQALSAEYLVKNAATLAKDVQEVPQDIDMACARMKIEAMGCAIDTLSDEQYRYLHSSGV
ncbi:MAG: adenosylhomocysteinase [Clostridia bacterium]|nr:adenosylhomocysteinase [Clostridia bacterium]